MSGRGISEGRTAGAKAQTGWRTRKVVEESSLTELESVGCLQGWHTPGVTCGHLPVPVSGLPSLAPPLPLPPPVYTQLYAPLPVRLLGLASRGFTVVYSLLLETAHAAPRPPASMSPAGEASLLGFVGPGGANVEEFGATLSLFLCFPSCSCISLSPPASWTAIEHSLLKLGEILANLSNAQLRSQAEQCGTLIRRYQLPGRWR